MNIDQIISDITSLTGPKLLMTVLIAIGYGLQKLPIIDNNRIPIVVIVFGMLLAPILVSWPSPGSVDPGLRFAGITAWVQVVAQGFLLGAASWGIHAGVLKKVIDERLSKNNGEPNGKFGTIDAMTSRSHSSLLALLFAIALAGCASVEEGADPIVVNAERAAELAYETFDVFLKLEFDNRAALLALDPKIHEVAEEIRREGPGWIEDLRWATREYKKNRTPENQSRVVAATTFLQSALNRAQMRLEQAKEKQ